MKVRDQEEIIRILKEIKAKSTTAIKGGSGGAARPEMRDAHIIWELGIAINNAIENSSVLEEKRKEWVRKISRKFDTEILGEGNEWCNSAYDWFIHFKTKEHYLFVAKLAGYRDDPVKNSFRKRRVRYLRPIFTKLEESTLSEAKTKKLIEELEDDSTLELNDEQYYSIIKKNRGRESIPWQYISDSIEDLQNLVEPVIDDEKNEENRTKLREALGKTLLTQISDALQLCVIDNKKDYDYAYNTAKKEFNKKAKTKYPKFEKLYESLKILLKNFDEKNKRIKKSFYYDLEQLSGNLDAIADEKVYQSYIIRKKNIGDVFG